MANRVGVGYRSICALAREATWGGNIAGFRFTVPIRSETMEQTIENMISGTMFGKSRYRWMPGLITVGGNIVMEAQPRGQGNIWRALLGSVATTNVVPNYVWKHTYTIADNLPSLQIEIFKDMIDTLSGDEISFLYQGCKINTLTLAADIGEFVIITPTFVGKEEITQANQIPVLDIQNLRVFNFAQGVFKVGDSEANIYRFDITINNNLSTDRNRKLFSRYIKEPVRNAPIEVTGNIELNWEYSEDTKEWAYTFYNNFVNGQESGFEITFEGGSLATDKKEYLKLKCDRIFFNGESPKVGGPGIIPITFPFTAMYNTVTSNAELVVELQTGTSDPDD